MEFIKKNKIMIIIFSLLVIMFVSIGLLLITFFPSGNEYGNRLKGIDKVSFSKKEIDTLESKIGDRNKIMDVSIDIKGRLINIIIKVEDDTELDDIKDHVKEKLELFSEEEQKYYDIQFYIKNANEKKEHYPKIGYKHKTSDEIKWSNN